MLPSAEPLLLSEACWAAYFAQCRWVIIVTLISLQNLVFAQLLQVTKNIIVSTATVGCGAKEFTVGSGGEKGGLLDLSYGGNIWRLLCQVKGFIDGATRIVMGISAELEVTEEADEAYNGG